MVTEYAYCNSIETAILEAILILLPVFFVKELGMLSAPK